MTDKKKKWIQSAFANIPMDESEIITKKRRNNSISTTITLNKKLGNEYTSRNWFEVFSPKSVSELAIHSKKISEIQEWLNQYERTKSKYPGQILLLTGPAGCGKTATVKAIAKDFNYEIVEWINPVDTNCIDIDQVVYNNILDAESHVDIFKRFLFRSSRYKSLFLQNNKRMTLVEDFPNKFIRDVDGFNEILESFRNYGKTPLIFIVTDTKRKNLDLAYTLFQEDVLQKYTIHHITMNAVSNTIMKKALNRICNILKNECLGKYKIPNQDIVESINLASQGDIRNAIINLHFVATHGDQYLDTDEITCSNSSSKSKGKIKKFKSIGRDESITLMHALGRVFNPKYTESSNAKFLHCPEEITDAFLTEPRNFLDFLFANYLKHFSNIANITEGIETLSCSDVLMSEYRDDMVVAIGLNAAIRGLMVHNKTSVSGWIPVKGLYKRSGCEDSFTKFIDASQNLSKKSIALDFRTYLNIIHPV